MVVNHLKNFLLGMKSLKESLFDDNIKRELTIRQTHDLADEPGIRGVRACGVPIGYFFDVKKLLRYPNPLDMDTRADSINCLIGIIADQPLPPKSNSSELEKWGENMKKILTKYVARAWKKEWDDKIEVYIKNWSTGPLLGYFSVIISFDGKAGTYEFIFKPKS